VMRKIKLLISTLLLTMLIGVLGFAPIWVYTQPVPQPKINWVRYINPTESRDEIRDICLIDDRIVVIGNADQSGYAVLLNKNTGEIIRDRFFIETNYLLGCLSAGDKLYVFGYSVGAYLWILYLFEVDKELNIVGKTESYLGEGTTYTGFIPSAYLDKDYIYVALSTFDPSRVMSWVRIEKGHMI